MKISRIVATGAFWGYSVALLAQTMPAPATSAPVVTEVAKNCPNNKNFDAWILCQVSDVLDKQQVGQNGKGTARQRESPSTDPRSTALVDESSATDFVSVAASLIPVSSGITQFNPTTGTTSTNSTTSGSGTVTSTVYALLAGFNKTSPTDPQFYKNHIFSRQVSFTIGSAASTQATDNTTTPSTVYGAKVLIINSRELYTNDNLDRIRKVQDKLSLATAASASLTQKIMAIMCSALHPDCLQERTLGAVTVSAGGTGYGIGDVLTVGGGKGGTVTVISVSDGVVTGIVVTASGSGYSVNGDVPTTGGGGTGAKVSVNALSSINNVRYLSFQANDLIDANYPNTVNALPAETKKQIEAVVESSIDPFSNLRTELYSAYDNISKGMQMSISGTANIRSGPGNSNYRAELIFDYGLSTRINWTVNGSFDYTDRKLALDSRGGRIATSFEGNLTNPTGGWSRSPLRLIFSGEGDWLSQQKPQYSFDAKLSVPITPGFDLPIEYRFANRTAQLNQNDSQVRFGLAVDLSRIAQALK
jgi:hypothetical protein